MVIIRFFTISIISVCAFGALVYTLSSLWGMDRKPAESSSQIAVMHLNKKGLEATAEEVRDAARAGNLSNLKLLGIAGINFNEPDALSRSALHLAIEHDQWEALELVEKYGGDIQHKDRDGQTPVSKLIKRGRIDIASQYIEKGASIQFREPDKTPALMSYLRERDFEAFDFLLENKADPNARDARGKSPLQLALEMGMPDRASQLLRAGSSAKQLKLNGIPVITALATHPEKYNVTEQDAPGLVTGLITAGADPEKSDTNSQLRPIIIAIRNSNKPMFDTLIANNVDVTDCVWQTIIDDREEMLKSLASQGAVLDIPGEDGDTPLVSLVRSGTKLHLVKALLDYGADPDQITVEGQRLLFMAIAITRTEEVMVLLNHENKPDVNKAMSYPVSSEFRKLRKGKSNLDWQFKNFKGITPIVLGVLCVNEELVEKMIQLGGVRNVYLSGTSTLYLSGRTGNVAIQQMILGVPHQNHLQKRNFIIDLSEQKVYFYKNGKIAKITKCSTGKRNYRTKPGEYVISDKKVDKVSTIYTDSKMPYFQRFSWSDFGFHQGNIGSRFASHGCIRLSWDSAKLFYKSSKVGDRVLIRP